MDSCLNKLNSLRLNINICGYMCTLRYTQNSGEIADNSSYLQGHLDLGTATGERLLNFCQVSILSTENFQFIFKLIAV